MAEKRAPRVYVNRRLAAGAEVELEAGQAHHLRSVLRLGRGASVSAFNAADGEWLCLIAEAGKSGMRLSIEHRLREAGPETDLWLLFAPVKRTRVDWLVEKATELGVSLFLPIWTARTQVERVNLVRLQAHAVAAAEQSERLSVPEIKAPERLDRVLTDWPAGRTLLLCDESRSGEPIGEAAAWVPLGPAAILIGPEGGFDQTELDAIGKLSFVTRIGLGPRVLRAETAALAAVAVFQAVAGDWRRARIDRSHLPKA